MGKFKGFGMEKQINFNKTTIPLNLIQIPQVIWTFQIFYCFELTTMSSSRATKYMCTADAI